MPLTNKTLLGFAFASADLLIETTAEGAITTALGAGEALAGSQDRKLEGAQLFDFFSRADRELVRVVFEGLSDGMRAGPIIVRLASQDGRDDRAASLSAFRLPQHNGAVSCVLTRALPTHAAGANGLHDRASFETAAVAVLEHARTRGLDIEMALVEMAGFEAAAQQAGEAAGAALRARLAAVIRAESYAGGSAAELGADRYALLRDGRETPQELSRRIGRLLNLDPALGISPVVHTVGRGDELSPDHLLKALRYAMDGFLREGCGDPPPADLGQAFERSVAQTMAQVGVLSRRVEARDFALHYQPVVSLKGPTTLHHYEALIRFGDQGAPFPMIRMAEEMDLVCALDAAVVDRALDVLTRSPGLVLAVNLSGRSIGNALFVSELCKRVKAHPQVRGRLMFELTESAAVGDLVQADRHLQSLRALGCEICLDDFGAGASSLAYLQQLNVDVVKFDGAFIRDLEHDSRGAAFISQLVRMCAEMKVETLAEMVETPLVEEVIRKAGVHMAQGWLYGAAAKEPVPFPPISAVAPSAPGRRRGAVDSWG
ncbi:EAL domain-containing protein [Phenylobacterium sp.]|uniref:EAL domain-containing protein n=1 Tax=Phenylobacterium sp. TaxID=1871053 RepID=UPI00272F5C37|nr:EAL domain-containing protein [Phenylobacterium sp.]MDP2212944.1 EAL domain-containing protein [Phenylobacterium sp.]